MLKLIAYVRHRLNERSTWLAFSAGAAGAASLAAPWSYIVSAIGVIAAMIPDGEATP
jgi:hypothetical protein